jgi:MFS transporter, DHA1 family, multidrug resistance protein
MKRMLPLLTLLTAFPALSTDMYLPALPMLSEFWHQPASVVNLTLVLFFVVFCFFLLVYGPVSDRFGRRRPLLVGIAVYVIASLACACANGVWMLLIARIFQAAGAASAAALSMAMCKDLFEGRMREQMLAHIAVSMALAPMLAPIIGSWILALFNWRCIFLVLMAMGVVAFWGVLRMPETLREANHCGAVQVAMGYVRLLGNRRYTSLTVMMALTALPFFAFIAGSSEIYITHFSLSEKQFGCFFAFNAVAMMAGAFTFSRLSHFMPSTRLLSIGLGGICIGGLGMALISHNSPWSLALPMWVVSFCCGICRPPSNHLILEQVTRDAGAASSLIAFCFMMFASAGMWLISLNWADRINVIALLAVVSGGITFFAWQVVLKKWRLHEPKGGLQPENVAVAVSENA